VAAARGEAIGGDGFHIARMRALDNVFREIRTRTGAQIMVANVTNALQQITGLSSAALQVKPRHLRMRSFTLHHRTQ